MEAYKIMYKIEVPYSELKPMMKYINSFLGLACSVDMLTWKIYPNAKELSESMGCFEALRNHIIGPPEHSPFQLNDPTVKCICPGDGASPSTGAMVAMRSAWEVYSVDPLIKDKKEWKNIKRLNIVQKRIEDFSIEAEKAVILAVHNHSKLIDCVKAVKNAKHISIIAIPCCVRQELYVKPDLEKFDRGIWSPQNKILIWYNIV